MSIATSTRKEMTDLLTMTKKWWLDTATKGLASEEELRKAKRLKLFMMYKDGSPPLREIPPAIFLLVNLTNLILFCNQIEFIPDTISRLKSLEHLDLRSNKIPSLPESIGDLPELKSINLSENKLRRIPESIGRLSKLESLRLYNNKIESLPGSIGKLSKLRVIRLHNNRLSSLPSSMALLSPDLDIGRHTYTYCDKIFFEGNSLVEFE